MTARRLSYVLSKGILVQSKLDQVNIERDKIAVRVVNNMNNCIGIRTTGNFLGIGFWLVGSLDWTIVRDNQGELVLVPLLK